MGRGGTPRRSQASSPLRGVGRPLLEAAQRFPAVPRVLQSSEGPSPRRGGVEGGVVLVRKESGGRRSDWGARVAGSSHTVPSPRAPPRPSHLVPAGSCPAAAARARSPGARRPPHPRFAEELALFAGRRSRSSSWEGGSDRRLLRAASGGREPGWRSCHLERRRRAGERVLGKGPGARGGQGLSVGAAPGGGPVPGCVCWGGGGSMRGSVRVRGRVAPGEEEQRPPLLKSPEFPWRV